MNDPDVIPIIKGAFEKDGTNKEIAELDKIEQETSRMVEGIDQSMRLNDQQKQDLKRKIIAQQYFQFAKRRKAIEDKYTNYDVKLETDCPLFKK